MATDIFGNPTSSYSPTDTLAKRQAQYDKLAKKAPPSLLHRITHGASSLVGDALNVLDLPRSGLVSSIAHLTGQSDTGRSLGYDITHHFGVGQFKAVQNLHNKWLQRAIGFAGDVALDPTTYLSFGATAVGEDAARAAGKDLTKEMVIKDLTDNAAKYGSEDARNALIQKVQKNGLTALDKADQEALGVKSAIKFKVPFGPSADVGGQAGENLARNVAKAGVYAKGLPVISAVNNGATQFFKSDAVKAVEGAIGTVTKPIKAMAFKGATVASQQDRKVFEKVYGDRLGQIFKAHKGADPAAVHWALQSTTLGDQGILDKVGQTNFAAYKDAKKWFDDIGRSMSDAGVEIGKVEEYSPIKFTEEYKKFRKDNGLIDKGLKGGAAQTKQRAVFDPKRTELFGVPITGTTTAERIKSMEDIYKNEWVNRYGGKPFDKAVLEDNAFSLMKAYLHSAGNAVESAALNRHVALSDVLSKNAPNAITEATAKHDEAATAKQTAQQLMLGGNEHAAEATAMAGQAAQDHANLVEQGFNPPTDEQAVKALNDPKSYESIRSAGQDALIAHTLGRQTEPWVPEAISRYEEALRPSNPTSIGRIYNKVTNLWKAQALLSPGFHFRNYMGGLFNNSLAGVDFKDYQLDAQMLKWVDKQGNYTGPAKFQKLWDAWEHVSTIGEHNIRDYGEIPGVGNNLASGIKKVIGTPTNLNYKAAGKVEDRLRRPLFIHEFLSNGGDVQKALDVVNLFHFDYQDLNKSEQALKRIIPFYTWSRKNFPLQIENMIRHPGKYTRWMHFQQNAQLGVPEDPNMPSFLRSLLAIRTPFVQNGGLLPKVGDNGSRIYFTPDLPFRDLAETLDPHKLLSSLNPLIKTPLELSIGEQLFQNKPFTGQYQPVPGEIKPLLHIPGHGIAIAILNKIPGAPHIKVDSKGNYVATDQDIYKLEQATPLLSRMRRVVPNTPTSQSRIFTSWASFAFGLSGYTNDPQMQTGELNRRIKELQSYGNNQKLLKGVNPLATPKAAKSSTKSPFGKKPFAAKKHKNPFGKSPFGG